VPKSEVKHKIKEELGDMLYYLTKIAEIGNITDVVEDRYLDTWELPIILDVNILAMLADANERTIKIVRSSTHNEGFIEGVAELLDLALYFIQWEGWELEDIQFSNLAKLQKRHGEKFDQNKANPENRDITGEDSALLGEQG